MRLFRASHAAQYALLSTRSPALDGRTRPRHRTAPASLSLARCEAGPCRDRSAVYLPCVQPLSVTSRRSVSHEPTPARTAAYAISTRAPPHQDSGVGAGGAADATARIAPVAWLGRYGAMLGPSPVGQHEPAIGSTIQATPIEMSSAATWLGMRMPAPRPIRRPEAEDEQAQRQGPQDRAGRRGTADIPRRRQHRGAGTDRRRRGRSRRRGRRCPSSDDDLGRHHPDPPRGGQEGAGDRLVPVLRADRMTPIASSQQVAELSPRDVDAGRRLRWGRAGSCGRPGRRHRGPTRR